MRILNDFERELVQHLLQANSAGVPNLPAMLDARLKDIDLVRTATGWEVHFSAAEFQPQELVHHVRWFVRTLVSAVHLLRELESNGLIVLYNEAPFPQPARFGQLVQGHQAITATVQDARVNRMLDEMAFSSILLNPGLAVYVREGFRMPDEVRAENDLRMNRRNLRIAAWALVLGVGIGLWQVCLAYREVHYGRIQVEQGEQTQQVELDTVQYRTLLQHMRTSCKEGDHHGVNDSTVTRKACCAKH